MNYNDTIAAISTPPGIGGIGIIRVSGKESVTIVDKIFKSPKGKKLSSVHTHTINYGYIISINNGDVIDEVLVSVMKSPNTFTKENVVEISCHGGFISTKAVLEEVVKAGARVADPGEFTKRAFLNGRIDLTQAEAIIDIINSKTRTEMGSAVKQLRGRLSVEINNIRNRLLELVGHIQAAVDYPEYDIPELGTSEFKEQLISVLKDIDYLIETSDVGKVVREGLSTVIIGKPNVGKSSLLNSLLKEKRAIVTEIPGTTRDIIEEYVNIAGVPLRIVDTAGIRETDELVEKIGVEKTVEFLNNADLIILMLDGSKKLSDDDKKIIDMVKNKNVIVLINKSDLKNILEIEYVNKYFDTDDIINVSVVTGYGLDKLEEKISSMFRSGKITINNDILITNVRHKESLEKSKQSVLNVLQAINEGMPIDVTIIDLHDALEYLGDITGNTVSDEIIDKIFHNFCVGKWGE